MIPWNNLVLCGTVVLLVGMVLSSLAYDDHLDAQRAIRLEPTVGACVESVHDLGSDESVTCHPLASIRDDGFGRFRCLCP